MTLLRLTNLSKTFETPQGPVHAVRDVTLETHQGECLAIVGESGSGKTTLANMVLGLFAPTAGTLTFDGEDLPHKRTKAHRRAIQLVQQNPLSSLNPKRSIGASVRLGLDTYGIGEASGRWEMVEEALEAVGLPGEMRKRAPSSLSGGQRQRVGIARALACDPRLVVLDEPTSALDVLVQARVLRLLNDLRAKRGLTYIFITHDLAVVRNVADRVAVFKSGQMVELGETAQIFTEPRHAYTRHLIGAVPVVDDTELKLRNSLAGGSMTHLTEALAEKDQPTAYFKALEVEVQKTIGAKLFTMMEIDYDRRMVKRNYTNMPKAYPTSGEKPFHDNAWHDQVQGRHETFVANSIEEIAAVFPDHELIQSLGCESCLNLPIVVGGVVIGTLNCLNVSGHYTPERVAASETLKHAGAVAFLLNANLKGRSQ